MKRVNWPFVVALLTVPAFGLSVWYCAVHGCLYLLGTPWAPFILTKVTLRY